MFFVLRSDVQAGREWALRLFDSGDVQLQMAVANAYSNPVLEDGTLAPADFQLLIRILGSASFGVVSNAAHIFHRLQETNPRSALDMLRYVNFQENTKLVDHVFMMFHSDQGRIFAALTEGDVEYLLGKLKNIKELSGHWVEILLSHLSRHFPEHTARFLIARVEMASQDGESSGMRPVNYGPWVHVPFRFRESDRFHALLDIVWDWVVSRDSAEWRFEHYALALFEAIALPVDATVKDFLASKMVVAKEQELVWIARILGRSKHSFVFENVDFVISFLEVCDRNNRAVRRRAVQELFRSSVSGVRGSRPGEPTNEDIESFELASQIIPRLSPASGASELYQMIRDHSERRINDAKRDAEPFDDG